MKFNPCPAYIVPQAMFLNWFLFCFVSNHCFIPNLPDIAGSFTPAGDAGDSKDSEEVIKLQFKVNELELKLKNTTRAESNKELAVQLSPSHDAMALRNMELQKEVAMAKEKYITRERRVLAALDTFAAKAATEKNPDEFYSFISKVIKACANFSKMYWNLFKKQMQQLQILLI